MSDPTLRPRGVILAERLADDLLFALDAFSLAVPAEATRSGGRIEFASIRDHQSPGKIWRGQRTFVRSRFIYLRIPHSTAPWFSAADDEGDSRLIPSLLSQMPGPHGSLVIAAGDTGIPTARVWTEGGESPRRRSSSERLSIFPAVSHERRNGLVLAATFGALGGGSARTHFEGSM